LLRKGKIRFKDAFAIECLALVFQTALFYLWQLLPLLKPHKRKIYKLMNTN